MWSCGVRGDPRKIFSLTGLALLSDNLSNEAIWDAAGGYVRDGKNDCLVGVGGNSNSLRGWLSNRADGDWACASSPSTLTKLLRREKSGLLKLLPKIPMPRAKGPGFGRLVVGGLNGDGGTASDCFGPVGNRLMGRLHGVSGMFLLDRSECWGSSAFRFFLEIRPVDMNAAGSGLTSL